LGSAALSLGLTQRNPVSGFGCVSPDLLRYFLINYPKSQYKPCVPQVAIVLLARNLLQGGKGGQSEGFTGDAQMSA
jgi:hypothetical protein